MGWMDDDWWDIQWLGKVMAHNTFFLLKVFLFVPTIPNKHDKFKGTLYHEYPF
jgi:hypothetical protein